MLTFREGTLHTRIPELRPVEMSDLRLELQKMKAGAVAEKFSEGGHNKWQLSLCGFPWKPSKTGNSEKHPPMCFRRGEWARVPSEVSFVILDSHAGMEGRLLSLASLFFGIL